MVEVTEIICPSPFCHRSIPPTSNFCPYCGHSAVLDNDVPGDRRRYTLTRVIKQGGQGSVYEGVDQRGQRYAIKEMLDNFTDEDERHEAIERFNAEAILLQKLAHPRIPRVFSHFTDGGRHYLTMDFVQGEDLQQVVERSGALPEAQVLAYAMQICDVLEYLHGNGLVYRDMKPSNVMIDATDGKVKLVDFGIAKVLKRTNQQGTQIGTPGYAPPEQYQGIATTASDIYALGATLHHLLTGRDPTEQPPFSFRPARDVNVRVSRRTSDVLQKALAMEPGNRFGTVAEFRAMLRPLAATGLSQDLRLPQPPLPARGVAYAQVAAPATFSKGGQPVRQSPLVPPGASARDEAVFSLPPAAPGSRSHAPGRVRGCFAQMVAVILIVLGLALLGWFWLSGQTGLSVQLSPMFQHGSSEPAQLSSSKQVYELEVVVAANADGIAIYDAFRQAYRQQVEQEFPGAVLNSARGISYVGQPQFIAAEGSGTRYRATVEGYVQFSQGP